MNWRAIMAAVMLWSMAGTASAVGRIADVTVYDAGAGRALPVYRHGGRFYVVGRPGNEYQIRIRNGTGAEVLAVVSVDGVNAVSGETANWHQTGYVLASRQRLVVKGWRKSLQRVAAFYFTEHANSYAARTGRPHNVGVIGVALFRKRAQPDARIGPAVPRTRGWWEQRNESPFPDDEDAAREGQGHSDSAAEPAPFEGAKGELGEAAGPRAGNRSQEAYPAEKSSSLGTGHGRSRTSHARYTTFQRASDSPAEIVTIHYDTYRNLVRLGVIGRRQMATPFPGQFVPDPL